MQHSQRPYGGGARSRQGFTLVEMMVAIGVLATLMGAIWGVFMMGMRLYSVHRAEYTSDSNASMALERGLRDLADAAIITCVRSEWFTYRKPARGTDGFYDLERHGGIAIQMTAVKLGDEMKLYKQGEALYLDNTSDAEAPMELATDVSSVHFLFDGLECSGTGGLIGGTQAAPFDVKTVTLVIGTQGESSGIAGRSQSETTVTKTVRLRNHL